MNSIHDELYFFITHFKYLSPNIKKPEITYVLRSSSNLGQSKRDTSNSRTMPEIEFYIPSLKKKCHNALRGGNEKEKLKKQ
jgi:hypothetical protein